MCFLLLFVFYIFFILKPNNKKKVIKKIVIKNNSRNDVEEFFKQKKNYNILINLTKNSKKYISIPELIDSITNIESKYYDPKIYEFFIEKKKYYGDDDFNLNYQNNVDSVISITDSINNKYIYGYPFLNFLKWTIQYKIVHNLNEKKQG